MKTYEKPRLMVLSISANDALCTGCSKGTRFDPFFQSIAQSYGNSDSVLEYGEGGLFAGEADDCTTPFDYDGYCKYASAENGNVQLFTS